MTVIDLNAELDTLRPMILNLARRFLGRGLDLDDLVGAANLALVEAARTFEPDGRASFKSYASHRVRGALIDAVRAARMIHVPKNYLGPSGARRAGPAADDARAMLARHFLNESQLGETSLSDLAVDYRYNTEPLPQEYPPMSRLNGTLDHPPATEPAPEAGRCPGCGKRYKSASTKRCYKPGCPRSGFPPKGTTRGPRKGKAMPKPPAPAPVPAPSVPRPQPRAMIAVDLGAETATMTTIATLLGGLHPSSRVRVLTWLTAAFN
jgi:RNA polymerase sigma factor (sigma-70 family)